MRLINNDGVVAAQHGIALRLGQQNPVCHQLDCRLRTAAVLKPDLITDPLAQRGLELVSDAFGHRTCRKPARLGMTDHFFQATPKLKTDLWQLSRFARAGLAADNNDLMLGDRPRDLEPACADWEIFGIDDLRGLTWGNDNAFGGNLWRYPRIRL